MRYGYWYFDFISPFAYLQFEQLRRDPPAGLELGLRPVLLAALLQHWGQLGPAEIPGKRRFTYRHAIWLARELDIPLRLPPAHPFNPLPALRLALALDCDAAAVGAIFRGIWAEGLRPDDPAGWKRLTAALDVADADARIGDEAVKQTLRRNTELAIADEVFGVPTTVVDGELFWGLDSLGLLRACLADPTLLASAPMRRAATLPLGVTRPRR